MEEIIEWLKEYLLSKRFVCAENECSMMINNSYSTSVEIDNDDNLIIGRYTDDIYSVFKLDESLNKNDIIDEIQFYLNYYKSKQAWNWNF